MKRLLIKLHWLLSSQFGLDPWRLLRSLRGVPAFFSAWRQFRRGYYGPLVWMPCLHDRYEEGGTTKSEYFWQDLLVARWIHAARPEKHVDVGSRVDGFVAHVASFREIEVFDVRPITTDIPGVVFKQADLTQTSVVPNSTRGGYCDSLSCLHALEHFGLGRYGDTIDPKGHEKGLANMVALLKPGGTFYLSLPIGCQRVEFNAHRVFDPRTILNLAEATGLVLKSLMVISGGGQVGEVKADVETLHNLAEAPYHLGIFTFLRLTDLKTTM
jgi:hypothetical protein